MFYVTSQDRMAQLSRSLRLHGQTRFLFVTVGSDRIGRPPVAEVDDGGLNFFSVSFYEGEVP